MEKALLMVSTLPVMVTMRSGQEPSEMLILAPLWKWSWGWAWDWDGGERGRVGSRDLVADLLDVVAALADDGADLLALHEEADGEDDAQGRGLPVPGLASTMGPV